MRLGHKAPAKGSEGGFTLIEAIIAVGLLAVVLGLVTTSLRILSAAWDRGVEQAESLDMVSRAVDVLSRDIGGIRRIVRDGQSRPAFVFDGSNDVLRFVTIEPAYPSEPGPYMIELDARASRDGKALVRSRSETAGADIDLGRAKFTDGVPLIEGNFAVTFSYRSDDGGRDTWSSSWSTSDRLPSMIEVRIEDKARKRLVVPPLRLPLLIDAEHVCTRGAAAANAKPRTTPEGREGEPREGPVEEEPDSVAKPVPEAAGSRADAASRTSDKTKKPEEDETKEAHPQLCSATAGGALSAAAQKDKEARAAKGKKPALPKGNGQGGSGRGDGG